MTIVRIGERAGGDGGDTVDALLACHQRIRSFLALGARVGQGGEAAEVADACRRIERYFREAMPLHVADEEETVLPRLRGRDAAVDRALAEMQEQHAAHLVGLTALTGAATALAAEPEEPVLCRQLAAKNLALSEALVPHLELEEAIIMPAMRRLLSPGELADIAAEIRARRR